MAQPIIKTSFASGEWAPKLRGRVDVQKYHAGAALMRNFFVDFSGGGASTRAGTMFVQQCKTSGSRLIEFQPSSTFGFALEFGNFYIRFYSDGAPVLETGFAISNVTNANPGIVTTAANNFVTGDWVYLSGMNGMGLLEGVAFQVNVLSSTTFSLINTQTGVPINTSNTSDYSPYVSGGIAQRVYTLNSPYAAVDLFPNPLTQNPGLKFVQDVNSIIITHPNYTPYILTEHTVTNWSLTNITFQPTIGTPTGLTLGSNLAAGTFTYGYVVTAVDNNGQESNPSSVATIGSLASIISSAGTIALSWSAVPGAVSYNIYRTSPTVSVTIASGAQFGFVGNVTGTLFNEATPGVAPDFAQGPPLAPSSGAAVQSISLTLNANYTTIPSVTLAAPPIGVTAAATASLTTFSVAPSSLIVNSALSNGNPATPVGFTLVLGFGLTVQITSATFISGINYSVTGLSQISGGSFSGAVGAAAPASITPPAGGPWQPGSPRFAFAVNTISGSVTISWTIGAFTITQPGYGYITAPAVTISGAATAVSGLGPTISGNSINPLATGNPSVVGFFQQRLVLAAPPGAVQTYYMSQPGLFFNFSISSPIQDNDAIQGSIVGEDLNDIRSLLSVPTGLIAFSGRGAWLINSGGGLSVNSPITPSNQSASPQAFAGANDLRPIKINYDFLYVTNKGNYVRDMSYNLYAATYTGSDISTISNHLFFGYYLIDWTWAEEPFKVAWAVRDDGLLLSLSYVKEQELIGWAHHDTDGQFRSTCSIIETLSTGQVVDAVYFVVDRFVGGNTFSFVERMNDRFLAYGAEDSWVVDCAVQTIPLVDVVGLTITGDPTAVGNSVTLSDVINAPFTSAMPANNYVVRADGGIYRMTAFTSASVVTAVVVQVSPSVNTYETGVSAIVVIKTPYTIWEPTLFPGGLNQLVGKTVTGVADGVVVPPQIVNSKGQVGLSTAATKVTLGLAYTPQLQTLPLDTGEPTIQSKRKKINAVTLRVADTLGLQIGTTFNNLVTMKDFTLGNIPTTSNGPAQVAGLVSGDGRTILDQVWQEPGQFCIQQNLPYPATIVGVIPELTVGDTPEGRK